MSVRSVSFLSVFLILTLSASAILSGCATSTKGSQEVEERPRPDASSPAALMKMASDTFSRAPGLTEEQKEKLAEIYRRTYSDAMVIRKEIAQNKALLFETVSSADYKSAEVERLKARLVDLDLKRLTLMFKALSDVQAVVGYGAEKKDIYRHLRDYEIPTHGKSVSEY